MNVPTSIAITAVRVADLLAEGERMPVYVHVIDHPDARVLVDTGMTELHPAVADLDPRLRPLSKQDFDIAGIEIVVNTHLHFDHCGGNHLFAGRPIYAQRRELDDARTENEYTIREWVDAPGVRYMPVDGELELLPGLRLVPAPGHTRGMQVVVVETGGRPVVVGGDVAVWFGELDEPRTEGQLRVRALEPELVWLAHEHEPWRPRAAQGITRRFTGPRVRQGTSLNRSRTVRNAPGARPAGQVSPQPRRERGTVVKSSRTSAKKADAKSAELLVAMTGKASPAKAAEGDRPVFAYIASLPQPQRGIAERIDALAAEQLPDLRRAVKWGMAYYGVGGGWCFSSGAFVGHVKLMFIRGTELDPEPPVTPVGMGKSTRGIELAFMDDLDERLAASWMKQAAAMPFFGGKKR